MPSGPESDILLKKMKRGGVITLWHVQKIYIENNPKFVVLPYYFGRILKIENSYKATVKFLWNSRLKEVEADKLCEKKNKKMQAGFCKECKKNVGRFA